MVEQSNTLWGSQYRCTLINKTPHGNCYAGRKFLGINLYCKDILYLVYSEI